MEAYLESIPEPMFPLYKQSLEAYLKRQIRGGQSHKQHCSEIVFGYSCGGLDFFLCQAHQFSINVGT